MNGALCGAFAVRRRRRAASSRASAPVAHGARDDRLRKPARSASARGTPGRSRTNADERRARLRAAHVGPSPASSNRTRYSLVRGSTNARDAAQCAAAHQRRERGASSAARSPVRRASGWRSSASSVKPSREIVPDQAQQPRRNRRQARRRRTPTAARAYRARAARRAENVGAERLAERAE